MFASPAEIHPVKAWHRAGPAAVIQRTNLTLNRVPADRTPV